MTNKNLGNLGRKESIISAYICHKHVIPGREGIWRAHERVLHLGLLALLSYISQDHVPWLAWCTMSWALPFQSLIKKMLPRLSCKLIFQKHFLYWGSLLSDDAPLYQIDRTQARNSREKYFIFSDNHLTISLFKLCPHKQYWALDTSYGKTNVIHGHFILLFTTKPNDISKGPTDIIREIETINM